jgi:hypothetical protein
MIRYDFWYDRGVCALCFGMFSGMHVLLHFIAQARVIQTQCQQLLCEGLRVIEFLITHVPAIQKGPRRVSQECYKSIAKVLEVGNKDVTRVVQEFTRVVQECYAVPENILEISYGDVVQFGLAVCRSERLACVVVMLLVVIELVVV